MNRQVYSEVERERINTNTNPAQPVQREVYHQEVVSNEPVVINEPAVMQAPPAPQAPYPVDNTVVRERTIVSSPAYTPTEWNVGRTIQILGYVLGVLEGVMLLRFVLRFIGANASNAFAQLVYGLSEPLVALFQNLIPNPAVGGANIVIEITTLLAMLCWALLFAAGVRLLRLVITPPERQ
jgi:uncharacterized protein YggT (Ycf19 family)